MNIGDFFVSLGFQADTQAIINFQTALGGLDSKFAIITDIINKAQKKLDEFTQSAIQTSTVLANFQAQTDLSTMGLQKWQIAGQLSNIGLTAGEVTSSIQSLQSNLAQIKLGGGDASPFMLLGISDVTTKNAYQVMDELSSKIKGLDSATAINLMGKMGLSPNLIQILREGNAQFSDLQKFFLNKQQQTDLQELGIKTRKLSLEFQLFKDQAIAKLAPVMTQRLIQPILDFMNKNSSKIIKFLADTGSFLVLIRDRVTNLEIAFKNSFDVLINKVGGLKEVFKTLFPLILGLSVAFAPLQTALLALFLLFDDIATWATGGDSLFGGFYDAIDKMIPKLEELAEIANKFIPLQKVFEAMAWIGGGAAIGSVIPGVGTAAGAVAGGAGYLGTQLGLHFAGSPQQIPQGYNTNNTSNTTHNNQQTDNSNTTVNNNYYNNTGQNGLNNAYNSMQYSI